MFQTLSYSPIFAGLSAEAIEKLLTGIVFQIKTYTKNHEIVHSGDECNALMILVEGSVRGEMLDSTGKIIKIEDIEVPRPIAPAFIFGMKNFFPVDVIANCDVKILYIPKPFFLMLLQREAQILKNYLNMISSRTQFLSEKIKFLSFSTIKGKLADYLLSLAPNNAAVITLSQSQQQMADMFGVARPSVARSLKEMEDEGYIKINKKEITLINRKELEWLK